MYKADLRSEEKREKKAHLQAVYMNTHCQRKRQEELELCLWSPNCITPAVSYCGGTAHVAERLLWRDTQHSEQRELCYRLSP